MLPFSIYIITLRNREDRIQRVKEFYKEYFDEFNIVYGANKSDIKNNKAEITSYLCNKFCTIPMIGCASSHISVWKEIAKTGSTKPVLVLEDDTFIDLGYLSKMYNSIVAMNEKYKYLFLQVIGEGLKQNEIEMMNGVKFDKFQYHLFLGAYMLDSVTAKYIFEYFQRAGISYHIDFSLNRISGLNKMLIDDPKLGQQTGLEDSNMSSEKKTLYSSNYPTLYYALTLPILSFLGVVVNLLLLTYVLLLVMGVLTKNFFVFALVGIFFFDVFMLDT